MDDRGPSASLADSSKLNAGRIYDVDRLRELIQRWKVVEPGFNALEVWVGVEAGVADAHLRSFGFSGPGTTLAK